MPARCRRGGSAGRDDHRYHLARLLGADRGSSASRYGWGRGCDREPLDHVAADAEHQTAMTRHDDGRGAAW